MPNFSQATLAGHIGKDAETKFTPSGKSVTQFSLAVSTGYGERKETSWFSVSVWGKEQLAQHLTKGKAVLVSGELRVREYDRKDGGKGTSVEVSAHSVTFLGGKDDGAEKTQPQSMPRSAQRPAAVTDDDVPF